MKKNLRIILAIFVCSFFLHFVWEMWQIPFYVDMLTANHWEAVWGCSQATFGDGIIALASYYLAALYVKNRAWIQSPNRSAFFIYMLAGLLITVVFEYFAVEILDRWQYSKYMPRLPIIGTGIIPLLQWVFIPPLALWGASVFLRGSSNNTVASTKQIVD